MITYSHFKVGKLAMEHNNFEGHKLQMPVQFVFLDVLVIETLMTKSRCTPVDAIIQKHELSASLASTYAKLHAFEC